MIDIPEEPTMSYMKRIKQIYATGIAVDRGREEVPTAVYSLPKNMVHYY